MDNDEKFEMFITLRNEIEQALKVYALNRGIILSEARVLRLMSFATSWKMAEAAIDTIAANKGCDHG